MPRKRAVTIIGRGQSSGLAPVGLVIRLKWDTGVCDIRCARSLVYLSTEPFWHFNDPPKWVDFYKEFSDYKPSTGLCAVFMALDRGHKVHLAGFDSVLDCTFMAGHDTRAERAALASFGSIIDLRNNEQIR